MALTLLDESGQKLSAWKDSFLDFVNTSFPNNASLYYQHIKKTAIGILKKFATGYDPASGWADLADYCWINGDWAGRKWMTKDRRNGKNKLRLTMITTE